MRKKRNLAQEAKLRQGYQDKPRSCGNCGFFSSDIEPKTAYGQTWNIEKNLQCVLGGFKVKKMGSCNEFSAKV